MNLTRSLMATLLIGSALSLAACSQPTPAPAGGTEGGAPAAQPGGGQPGAVGTDYPKPSMQETKPTEPAAGYIPPSQYTPTPVPAGYPAPPVTNTGAISGTAGVTGTGAAKP